MIEKWYFTPLQDRSHQAHQRSDKTFEQVSYGDTIFSGNSVREREIIASRVFDICILIEGDCSVFLPPANEVTGR